MKDIRSEVRIPSLPPTFSLFSRFNSRVNFGRILTRDRGKGSWELEGSKATDAIVRWRTAHVHVKVKTKNPRDLAGYV